MLLAAKNSIKCLMLVGLLSACDNTTLGSRSFSESASFTIPPVPFTGTLTLEVPINLAEQTEYEEGDFDYVTSVKVRDRICIEYGFKTTGWH